MKHVFLLGVMALLSFQAQALVADKFKCDLNIKEFGNGYSTEHEQEFYALRLPLSASPAPDVRFTAAQSDSILKLDTPHGRLYAHLAFYYKHATRIDANGNITDARQTSCIHIIGGYCEGSGGENFCLTSPVICDEYPDPFDQVHGWTVVPVVNGEPAFTRSRMSPATAHVRDRNGAKVASIDLTCEHLGTFP